MSTGSQARPLHPPPKHAGIVETPVGVSQEVSTHFFFNRVLPPLRHHLDAVQVVQTLLAPVKSSSYRPITLQNRWRGFAKDPADSDRSPDHIFRHLEGTVKAIIKASGLDVEPLLDFHNNSTCVTTFQDRTADTLPDAMLLCGSQRTWTAIAVCGEYKKDDTESDVDDNIAKVTSSMNNCMQRDPRRRFVYGFTIENSDMKLWFCDRSQILVSKPFNFITDHQYLVHFFLSVLYAEPYELGWDPTMTPFDDGRNFNITIRSDEGSSRTYRTLELLADCSAHGLLSKGTRVWKAVRVEDGEECGEPVALKDFWADPGRTPEAITTELIRSAATTDDTQRFVDQLFPKVEWHGDVFSGAEDSLDRTRSFTEKEQTTNRDLTNKANTEGCHAMKRSHIAELVHRRIVFAPACQKPIHRETSLANIFRGLAGVAYALQLMHDAGWVHRDVSAGNIVLGENGQARLVDFEYAKKMSEDGELHIGTTYFMAVEVEAQRYIFRPPQDYGSLTDVRPYLIRDIMLGIVPEDQSPPMPLPEMRKIYPVRYNPLHDLESLWWIAVYLVTKREAYRNAGDMTAGGHGNTRDWRSNQQHLYADKLFHDRLGERTHALYIQGNFSSGSMKVIHPSMIPVVDLLETLRTILTSRFSEVEKDIPSIDQRCADGLHVQFMSTFLKIARDDKLRNIKLRPFSHDERTNAKPRIQAGGRVGAAGTAATNTGTAAQDHSWVLQEATGHQAPDVPVEGKPSKTPKSTLRRKPAAEAPVHRYNLRPRPKRS